MANVYKARIDIKNVAPNFKPVFVQYDHAILEVELVDNGRVYNLANVDRVEFTHVRKDGLVIIQPGEIVADDKKQFIRYEYQGSEMELWGIVKTSFAIFDTNNKKVSTHTFNVSIVKDLREDLFEPAAPNYGLLQTLIEDVEFVIASGGIKGDPGPQGPKGDKGNDGKDGVNGKDTRLDNYITSSKFEFNSVSSSSRLLWNSVTQTIVNENTVNAVVTGTSGYIGFAIPNDPTKKFMGVYTLTNTGTINIASLRARVDYRYTVNGSHNIGDYTKAMGEVARHYGLPFIDLYGKSGINAFSLNNFTRDGIHLNWDGYVRVAEVIVGDLQGLEPI